MPLRPWCFKRIPPGAVEPILLSRNPKVKEKSFQLRDEMCPIQFKVGRLHSVFELNGIS